MHTNVVDSKIHGIIDVDSVTIDEIEDIEAQGVGIWGQTPGECFCAFEGSG